MNKRKNTKYNPPPWNENRTVAYEFTFKRKLVTPGMQFKVKNDRTVYTFRMLVTDIRTGNTWIEAITNEGYRFLRPEKVFKLVGVKRSYAKKADAA